MKHHPPDEGNPHVNVTVGGVLNLTADGSDSTATFGGGNVRLTVNRVMRPPVKFVGLVLSRPRQRQRQRREQRHVARATSSGDDPDPEPPRRRGYLRPVGESLADELNRLVPCATRGETLECERCDLDDVELNVSVAAGERWVCVACHVEAAS